jgi:tetratricopeptide (TPR) repeat protein
MDLTTLAAALLLAFGVLTTDAIMHANSVVVEVTAPPKTDKTVIDQGTIEEEFSEQLFAIGRIESVVEPPEIRVSSEQGFGMALAKETRMEDVAHALQSELGYRPDLLRLALFTEDGSIRALVSGNGRRVGSFHQVLVPQKDESLLAFVHRCALWGASQLAPYATSVYLLQKHAADKDFSDAIALIEQSKAKLPPTPVHFDRSAFDNLLGIVALFHNDPKAARALFEKAVAEYPAGDVAVLNAAFTDLVLDDNSKAAKRMQELLAKAPPTNNTLQATAYFTWAAAEMGLHDLAQADQLLAKSYQADPQSATGLDLWADLKEQQGDKTAAADLRRKALQATETFENYAEVAALYFQLSWRDNQPVTRSKFVNPTVVTFH